MRTKTINGSSILLLIVVFFLLFRYDFAVAQNFQPPQSHVFGSTGNGSRSVLAFADLDGDGDYDMMCGDPNGNFYYYQNTGTTTSPHYSGSVPNPPGLTGTDGYSAPAFADLDGDGNPDMVSGSMYGSFYFSRNTGIATSPQYTAASANSIGLTGTDGFSTPAFVDLDGDGDPDMMAGTMDGTFLFYRNNQFNSIADEGKQHVSMTCYPNPTDGKFIVSLDNPGFMNHEKQELAIINPYGQIVFQSPFQKQFLSFDISAQPNGMYLVKFSNGMTDFSSTIIKR